MQGKVKTIVINRAFELAPWADVVYGCDAGFWRAYPKALECQGVKVCYDSEFCALHQDLNNVKVEFSHKISSEPGVLGSGGICGAGGNSGFQALNLALQFGANPILLLGYDMTDKAGLHFHGKHPPPLQNPSPDMFDRWRSAFNKAEAGLRSQGIKILNCTPRGTLNMFQKMSLEEALSGLSCDA